MVDYDIVRISVAVMKVKDRDMYHFYHTVLIEMQDIAIDIFLAWYRSCDDNDSTNRFIRNEIGSFTM